MISSDDNDVKLLNVTPHTFTGVGQSRLLFWTGRVAIGLRYERPPQRVISESMEWLQDICLRCEKPLSATPLPQRWKLDIEQWAEVAIAVLLMLVTFLGMVNGRPWPW